MPRDRRLAGGSRAASGARRDQVIGDHAGERRERRERDQQRNAPVRPAAFPEPERGGWFGHADRGSGLRRAVAGVVLRDRPLARDDPADSPNSGHEPCKRHPPTEPDPAQRPAPTRPPRPTRGPPDSPPTPAG